MVRQQNVCLGFPAQVIHKQRLDIKRYLSLAVLCKHTLPPRRCRLKQIVSSVIDMRCASLRITVVIHRFFTVSKLHLGPECAVIEVNILMHPHPLIKQNRMVRILHAYIGCSLQSIHSVRLCKIIYTRMCQCLIADVPFSERSIWQPVFHPACNQIHFISVGIKKSTQAFNRYRVQFVIGIKKDNILSLCTSNAQIPGL